MYQKLRSQIEAQYSHIASLYPARFQSFTEDSAAFYHLRANDSIQSRSRPL